MNELLSMSRALRSNRIDRVEGGRERGVGRGGWEYPQGCPGSALLGNAGKERRGAGDGVTEDQRGQSEGLLQNLPGLGPHGGSSVVSASFSRSQSLSGQPAGRGRRREG